MRYFGTDGIRGEAYVTLTDSLARKVGKSLKLLNCKKVVIGYDTRESNHMLADNIALGAKSADKEVIDLGIIPTPGLCYVSTLEKCIGVMITASHNPYQDNGIKIFYDGAKIKDEIEEQIEDFIDNNDDVVRESLKGSIKKDELKKNLYVEFLNSLVIDSNLKVGFDCANGATSFVSEFFRPHLKEALYIAHEPNGKNINAGVGSTHIEAIEKFVKEHHLNIGFAFDGDGDRVLAVDENGTLHSGDELIYVIAKDLKENGYLNNNTVVLTIMSNLGIINSLNKLGIKVSTTTVGDRNVLKEMQLHNYVIGGENSGHIINLRHLSTGDGMLSAIMILNIMTKTNKSLLELTKDLEIWPDKLVNLKVKDKKIANEDIVKNEVNKIKEQYPNIQLVIRASGTENLLRVSCCAESKELVNEIIEHFVTLINKIDQGAK